MVVHQEEGEGRERKIRKPILSSSRAKPACPCTPPQLGHCKQPVRRGAQPEHTRARQSGIISTTCPRGPCAPILNHIGSESKKGKARVKRTDDERGKTAFEFLLLAEIRSPGSLISCPRTNLACTHSAASVLSRKSHFFLYCWNVPFQEVLKSLQESLCFIYLFIFVILEKLSAADLFIKVAKHRLSKITRAVLLMLL